MSAGTLEHTDLPQHEIFGNDITERTIDTLLTNEFLQVVDVREATALNGVN